MTSQFPCIRERNGELFNAAIGSAALSPASPQSLNRVELCTTKKPSNFFELLFQAGLIDETGKLKKEIKLPPFPRLHASQEELFECEYDKPFFPKGSSSCVTLRELLTFLYKNAPYPFASMEFVGGIARKALLSSEEFTTDAISLLTGLSPHCFEHLITKSALKEATRQLPDVDIWIHTGFSERSELMQCSSNTVRFFAQKLSLPPLQVKQHFFSKFNIVDDENNQFTIATPKSRDKPDWELLFVKKLSRLNLFSHEFRIGFLPHLFGNGPLSLQGDTEHLWQAFIYLLTDTLHIENPEKVDQYGLVLLISQLTQGRMIREDTAIKQLLEKQQHILFVDNCLNTTQLTTILSRTIRNHFPHSALEALAFFINFCNFFPMSSQEVKKIWKELSHEQLPSSISESESLLQFTFHALNSHNQSYPYILSALLLYAFSQGAEQIQMATRSYCRLPLQHIPAFLILPCKREALETALSMLQKMCNKDNEISSFINLLCNWNTSAAAAPVVDENAIEKAISLLENPDQRVAFFGYSFLLSCYLRTKNEALYPSLIKKFPAIYHFLSPENRLRLLAAMKPLCCEEISRFERYLQEDQGNGDIRCHWAKALFYSKNVEMVNLGATLWLQERQNVPFDVRQKGDYAYILKLLDTNMMLSLRLFKKRQQDAETRAEVYEFSLLKEILQRILALPQAQFLVYSQRAGSLLQQSLASRLKKCSAEKFPSAFFDTFCAFIREMTKSEDSKVVYRLVKSCLPKAISPLHHQKLYQLWLDLLACNSEDPLDLFSLWEDFDKPFETFSLYQDAEFSRHCTLLQQILQEESSKPFALQHLEALLLKVPENNLPAPLAHAYILYCLGSKKYKEAKHLLAGSFFAKEEKIRLALSAFEKTAEEQLLRLILQELAKQELSENLKISLAQQLTDAAERMAPVNPHIYEMVAAEIALLADCLLKGNDIDRVGRMLEAVKAQTSQEKVRDVYLKLITVLVEKKDNQAASAWLARVFAFLEKTQDAALLAPFLLPIQQLDPHVETSSYLAFASTLKPFFETALSVRVLHLIQRREIDFPTAAELVKRYHAFDALAWQTLFSEIPSLALSACVDLYLPWLNNQQKPSATLKETLTVIAKRIHDVSPRSYEILTTCLRSKDSVFHQLLPPSSPDRIYFLEKFFHALAQSAHNISSLMEFYNILKNELNNCEHAATLNACSITMAHALIKRDNQAAFELAYEITLQLTTAAIEHGSLSHNAELQQLTLSLLQAGSFFDQLPISDFLANFASILLKNVKNDTFLYEIAAALSSYRSLAVLRECKKYLIAIKNNAGTRKILARFLPTWLQTSYESASFPEQYENINAFSTYAKDLDSKSPELLACACTALKTLLKWRKEKMLSSTLQITVPAPFETEVAFLSAFQTWVPVIFQLAFHFSETIEVNETQMDTLDRPLITCETPDKSARHRYFSLMHTVISDILSSAPEESLTESYFCDFVMIHLRQLISQYQEHHQLLLQALNSLYYRYPPTFGPFFEAHSKQCYQLATFAIKKNIYKSNLTDAYKAILYLQHQEGGFHGWKNFTSQILVDVIDHTLSFRTRCSVLRAIQLMKGVQNNIKHQPEITCRIYKKIIQAMKALTELAVKGSVFFEHIKESVISNSHIFGANADTFIRSEMCKILFHEILSFAEHSRLYKYEGNPLRKDKVLCWLCKFLLLVGEQKTFSHPTGIKDFFNFSQLLVRAALEEFTILDNHNDREMIVENLMINIIMLLSTPFLGIGKPLPPKLDRKRRQLIKDVLVGVSSYPSICKKYLNMAITYSFIDPVAQRAVMEAMAISCGKAGSQGSK